MRRLAILLAAMSALAACAPVPGAPTTTTPPTTVPQPPTPLSELIYDEVVNQPFRNTMRDPWPTAGPFDASSFRSITVISNSYCHDGIELAYQSSNGELVYFASISNNSGQLRGTVSNPPPAVVFEFRANEVPCDGPVVIWGNR